MGGFFAALRATPGKGSGVGVVEWGRFVVNVDPLRGREKIEWPERAWRPGAPAT
jgi:hypothetical protein